MVFISAPYTHIDPAIVADRMMKVSQYFAKLLSQNIICLSPLATGQFILDRTTIRSDFDFWKNLSLRYIDACDTVHVLMLPGWDVSTGVSVEIEHAKNVGKKIIFVHENEIQHVDTE